MSENDAAFEALLEFLKRTRGIDFTGYKRTSPQRRFRRRMEVVGCDSFGDYLDHLEVAPMEYEQLFEMLLIACVSASSSMSVWRRSSPARGTRRCPAARPAPSRPFTPPGRTRSPRSTPGRAHARPCLEQRRQHVFAQVVPHRRVAEEPRDVELAFSPERGDARRLKVTITPLLSADTLPLGASIRFEDVTRYAALQPSSTATVATSRSPTRSCRRRSTSSRRPTRSCGRPTRSGTANEELETINYELRERTGELDHVNESLEAILTSLGLGVAVLDPHQRVQVWNRRAEDLWGMRADEAVDNHFPSLDVGLPSEQLAPALRAVLGGGSDRETAELDAINRRGRPIVCEATVVSSASGGSHVRGAIVMMEDRPRDDGGAPSQ